MSKEPILETERLILRPITLDDAAACFSWNSDERVAKYMSYPTLTDEKEYNFAFVLKKENKVIGTGSIGPSSKLEGYWGMGYNLHFDYWHKGYCTEAMKAIIDYVHKELGVNRICSCHAVDNPRSGKVMEKCGLKFDHYDEITKYDNSATFKAKAYVMEIKE